MASKSSEGKRQTKNSLKVAAFEKQKLVIEQVLAESKLLDKTAIMSKNNPSDKDGKQDGNNVNTPETGKKPGQDGSDVTVKHFSSEATQTNLEGPPEKRQKTGSRNHKENKSSSDYSRNNFWGDKQILPYPGYDDNAEWGSGFNRLDERSFSANDTFLAGMEMPRGKATRTATSTTVAGASSGKMEAPLLFSENEHQISDNSDDDVEYDRDSFLWDNASLASSAIFQDGGEGRHESVPTGTKVSKDKHGTPEGLLEGPSRETKSGNAIERLIKEKAGKDSAEDKTGPPVADFVADMLKVFIKAPDTEGIFKLVDDYPRPSNAEWLKTPQLGKQVAASIPKRSNSYDKKLKQTQMCMGAALTASTRVLQGLMEKANEDPSLVPLGRLAVDALSLGAYVHSDINTIRKGAIRQVINPSYAGFSPGAQFLHRIHS